MDEFEELEGEFTADDACKIIKIIKDQPTVGFRASTPEVIYCRYCKSQQGCLIARHLGDDGFCSNGKPMMSIGRLRKKNPLVDIKPKEIPIVNRDNEYHGDPARSTAERPKRKGYKSWKI